MEGIQNNHFSDQGIRWFPAAAENSHLIASTRIECCSLDLLAAIANEKAKIEFKKDEEFHYSPSYDQDDTESSSSSSNEYCDDQANAEESAATTLLMASIVDKSKPKKKGKECGDDESRFQRWKRLDQNQQYRRKLQEKGVHPIRKGPKSYMCSLCSETFDKEMFVWRHGVKHLEQKPFKCNLCRGKFNRSDSLQRHVRNFHRNV